MANYQLTQTGQQIQADLDLLDNNQATSGQVLTADGSGGASWQNAGGGSSYMHYIEFTLSVDGRSCYVNLTIINESSSLISTSGQLKSELARVFGIGSRIHPSTLNAASTSSQNWVGNIFDIYINGASTIYYRYKKYSYTIDNNNIVVTETTSDNQTFATTPTDYVTEI